MRAWWTRLGYCDKETLKRNVAASGHVLGIDATPEEVERYLATAEHIRLYAQVDAAPPLVQPRAPSARPAANSASISAGNVVPDRLPTGSFVQLKGLGQPAGAEWHY